MAIVQRVVARLSASDGYAEMILSYDDVDERVTAVSYTNTSSVPCYLEIRPAGAAVLRFDLPASTAETRNIAAGQRPLLDAGMQMGWAPLSLSSKK